MARRMSRTWLSAGIGILLLAFLIYAYWPRPLLVDMGVAERGPMVMTLDEEAKTRVRDAYVVSAPVAGRLMRVEVEPGDRVRGGISVVAQMLPINPSVLDIRTREQARAAVSAAEAALRVSRADLNKAVADRDLAEAEVERTRQLRDGGNVSEAALDQAERAFRAARAAHDMASAAISMREAELANARARLISFSERPEPMGSALPADGESVPIRAPVSGSILRVMQESETTLSAGAPILEIGDISNDLEIVAELLSTDAVQVDPGDRVIIEDWGGEDQLNGVVERVEPWGFTKFSALGVEEQRVNTLIQFSDPLDVRASLGHGFRVETRIVIWESDDALVVPSSALFRSDGGWAVFTVRGGRARLTPIEIGHNNGLQAEVLGGLEDGVQLVLFPPPGLDDGMAVRRRSIS